MFVSTQDSVDFHHTVMQEVLCSADEEDSVRQDVGGARNKDADDLLLFKLHGDMPQKVFMSMSNVYFPLWS